MKLIILSTPEGQIPAIHFEVEDTTLEEMQRQTEFSVYTITENDDDSATATKGFHFTNRIGFLLFDEASKDPAFDFGYFEIESMTPAFRHPADLREADEEFDYPTDINEMTPEQISSRTIR